jgi:hypothetical protein
MDQTLRVDLLMDIGTIPRRTIRLGNQNIKNQQAGKLKQQAENCSPSHCQVLGLKTKSLSNLGLEKIKHLQPKNTDAHFKTETSTNSPRSTSSNHSQGINTKAADWNKQGGWLG